MLPPTAGLPDVREPWTARMKRVLLGRKRELHPQVFHKVSLIALLAWVGLGADGLSSSAYGPEEAFRTLGAHTYLAMALAVATAFTVLVISYAYSRIIEQFPLGGGGYVVASRLLGRRAGVVSGCALVVDYVLTISISIAAAGDAIFSFLPPAWSGVVALGVPVKLVVEFAAIAFLILLNLRGVKESVIALAPLFLTFLVSHAILIGGVILGRADDIPAVFREVRDGFGQGLHAPPLGLGLAGMLALFVRAYALGGGTYTGIEAVSNGLSIMREPKVQTGKRTMALMAVSLAVTAGGLILAYLLVHATPAPGRTMNAVLASRFAGGWGGIGAAFVFLTLTLVTGIAFSEEIFGRALRADHKTVFAILSWLIAPLQPALRPAHHVVRCAVDRWRVAAGARLHRRGRDPFGSTVFDQRVSDLLPVRARDVPILGA